MPTPELFTFSVAASGIIPGFATNTGRSPVGRCLRLDPTTGDLDHDGKRLQIAYDVDAIAQSLRTRLAFFMGEWFLDESFGVPYFQTILGTKVPLAAVREAFRTVIAGTVGVLDVLSLSLEASSVPRSFVLRFTVSTDLGELDLTVTAGVP